jgi:flagellar hook-length control protein FliK
MLAQSATHETTGTSAADALTAGAKAKKKKPQLFAGLFSEILSQAQRGKGAVGLEGPKAQPSSGKKADALEPKAVDAAKKAAATIAPKVKTQGLAGSGLLRESADAHHAEAHQADEARTRKKGDKKMPGQPDEFAPAEAAAARGGEDKRRLRPAKEAAPEEILALGDKRAASKTGSGDEAQIAMKAKASKDEAERTAEEKKRGGGQSDSKISLLDLRRSVESRREAAAKVEPKSEDAPSKETIREVKSGGQGHELVRDLSLESRHAGEARLPSDIDRGSAARGPDFQSMLSERMREAWNGEIVKSAHIVLRDGDAGTIRLRLKPESLGNVKVELNLSDNNISGRILVESDEAKTAFEKNMNQLADAFMQGGFDSAKLEVSVGGGSGQGASGKGSGDASGPFYSERLRSAVGSSADPATAVSAYGRRGGAVDMFA